MFSNCTGTCWVLRGRLQAPTCSQKKNDKGKCQRQYARSFTMSFSTAITPCQCESTCEPRSQTDSFTGQTNHGFNAVRYVAVKTKSKRTSRMAAEQKSTPTFTGGSTATHTSQTFIQVLFSGHIHRRQTATALPVNLDLILSTVFLSLGFVEPRACILQLPTHCVMKVPTVTRFLT